MRIRRVALTTGLAGVMLILAASCGDAGGEVAKDDSRVDPGAAQLQPSEPAASMPNTDVDDPLADAGLREVARSSDLVVQGTVTGARNDVSIASDESVRYTVLTVDIAEVLVGTAPSNSVEVALMSEIDGASARVEGLPMPHIGDEGIWMLTTVDPTFGFEGYVVTSTGSMLLIDDDDRIWNEGEAASLREAKGLSSLQAIKGRIRGKS